MDEHINKRVDTHLDESSKDYYSIRKDIIEKIIKVVLTKSRSEDIAFNELSNEFPEEFRQNQQFRDNLHKLHNLCLGIVGMKQSDENISNDIIKNSINKVMSDNTEAKSILDKLIQIMHNILKSLGLKKESTEEKVERILLNSGINARDHINAISSIVDTKRRSQDEILDKQYVIEKTIRAALQHEALQNNKKGGFTFEKLLKNFPEKFHENKEFSDELYDLYIVCISLINMKNNKEVTDFSMREKIIYDSLMSDYYKKTTKVVRIQPKDIAQEEARDAMSILIKSSKTAVNTITKIINDKERSR